MLVLSRRVGEEIYLDDGDISLMVVDVRGGAVRIGITAPDDVAIRRGELFHAIDRNDVHANTLAAMRQSVPPPQLNATLSGPLDL